MARFEDAIPVVLKHEGGWSNNPNDPGGPTKYGVSLRWLKTQGFAGDLDHDGDVDAQDVRLITPEIATAFYRDEFWKPAYGRMLSQAVATKVFDTAVNTGPMVAHRILQRALAALGKPVTADGWLGEKTLLAVDQCDAGDLLARFRFYQREFYAAVIAKNPRLAAFARGWENRAAS